MSACLMVGAAMWTLSSPECTLHWTHSVENVAWVETWAIEPAGLRLTRAAVKGSGAGMEPGEGATLEGGWWVWSPMTVVPELTLAASGATGGGWTLCDGADCRVVGAEAGNALVIAPCPS